MIGASRRAAGGVLRQRLRRPRRRWRTPTSRATRTSSPWPPAPRRPRPRGHGQAQPGRCSRRSPPASAATRPSGPVDGLKAAKARGLRHTPTSRPGGTGGQGQRARGAPPAGLAAREHHRRAAGTTYDSWWGASGDRVRPRAEAAAERAAGGRLRAADDAGRAGAVPHRDALHADRPRGGRGTASSPTTRGSPPSARSPTSSPCSVTDVSPTRTRTHRSSSPGAPGGSSPTPPSAAISTSCTPTTRTAGCGPPDVEMLLMVFVIGDEPTDVRVLRWRAWTPTPMYSTPTARCRPPFPTTWSGRRRPTPTASGVTPLSTCTASRPSTSSAANGWRGCPTRSAGGWSCPRAGRRAAGPRRAAGGHRGWANCSSSASSRTARPVSASTCTTGSPAPSPRRRRAGGQRSCPGTRASCSRVATPCGTARPNLRRRRQRQLHVPPARGRPQRRGPALRLQPPVDRRYILCAYNPVPKTMANPVAAAGYGWFADGTSGPPRVPQGQPGPRLGIYTRPLRRPTLRPPCPPVRSRPRRQPRARPGPRRVLRPGARLERPGFNEAGFEALIARAGRCSTPSVAPGSRGPGLAGQLRRLGRTAGSVLDEFAAVAEAKQRPTSRSSPSGPTSTAT